MVILIASLIESPGASSYTSQLPSVFTGLTKNVSLLYADDVDDVDAKNSVAIIAERNKNGIFLDIFLILIFILNGMLEIIFLTPAIITFFILKEYVLSFSAV